MNSTINQLFTSVVKTEPMARHSVFGITTSPIHAALTVERLKSAKFKVDSISVLLADPRMNWPFTKNKPHQVSEAAIAGASTGTVVAVTWGWMDGIGALTIPGAGLFVAAGPIVAAMSGASVGAAVDGVCGGLIGMGIPETEAKGYEKKILNGEVLLSVHTKTRGDMNRAKDIFVESRADDIWANDAPYGRPADAVKSEPLPIQTSACAPA